MPRPRIPSYRLHKATGQAVVTLSGVDHYLGRHNTPESKARYERLVAEWLAGGRAPLSSPGSGITVAEVVAQWLGVCDKRAYGASQLDRIRKTFRIVISLYGDRPATEFRGRALLAVREEMVRQKVSRRHLNQRIRLVKQGWRWALANELVPADATASVLAVSGLRAGEADVPEPARILPVSRDVVRLTLPYLPVTLADVARLQLEAGMRPGEVLAMRAEEIDASRPHLWIWRPKKHKTAHRGHARQVFLARGAIDLVSAYLLARCPLCGTEGRQGRLRFRDGLCGPCADRQDEQGTCGPWKPILLPGDYYLFSPRRSQAERFEDMRANRKSKVQPSQLDRGKDKPKKGPGERYKIATYHRAVTIACQKAGVERWHPHQLRHTAGTDFAKAHGWEVARILLGHRSLDTTRIYAEDDIEGAMRALLGD